MARCVQRADRWTGSTATNATDFLHRLLPVVGPGDDLEDGRARAGLTNLDDTDFDAEEVDAGVGSLVQPVKRAPVVVAELRSDPDNRDRLETGGVHEQLTQVAVVCLLELVLNDHDPVVKRLRLDVEPELAHRYLGRF